jgi:hypothetical protein
VLSRARHLREAAQDRGDLCRREDLEDALSGAVDVRAEDSLARRLDLGKFGNVAAFVGPLGQSPHRQLLLHGLARDLPQAVRDVVLHAHGGEAVDCLEERREVGSDVGCGRR